MFSLTHPTLSPDELRARLFDAAASNPRDFVKLLDEHEATVREHALSWRQVPAEYETALDWYAQGLHALAEELARRGYPRLAQCLNPPADPLERWEQALEQVERCKAHGHFRDGATTAEAIVGHIKESCGAGVDIYLPITLSKHAECLFHAGEVELARAPLQEALAYCRAMGHQDGIVACLESLVEVQRYCGKTQAAAQTLHELADVLETLGRTDAAQARRRQAARVRRGEPLCRVVCSLDGVAYELDEVPAQWQASQVRFAFARNRMALGASEAAVLKGVRRSEGGDLEAAIALFEQAAAADRFNPWPHYHLGATLLLLGRYAQAALAFEDTERLAPGFYHVRSDRWLAAQLQARALPHDLLRLLRYLQDDATSAGEVVRRVASAVKTTPVALLYLLGGDALRKLQRPRAAERWYREGLQAAEEADVRTRLLTALGTLTEDTAERAALLDQAVALRGNLIAAAAAQLALKNGGPHHFH